MKNNSHDSTNSDKTVQIIQHMIDTLAIFNSFTYLIIILFW